MTVTGPRKLESCPAPCVAVRDRWRIGSPTRRKRARRARIRGAGPGWRPAPQGGYLTGACASRQNCGAGRSQRPAPPAGYAGLGGASVVASALAAVVTAIAGLLAVLGLVLRLLVGVLRVVRPVGLVLIPVCLVVSLVRV